MKSNIHDIVAEAQRRELGFSKERVINFVKGYKEVK